MYIRSDAMGSARADTAKSLTFSSSLLKAKQYKNTTYMVSALLFAHHDSVCSDGRVMGIAQLLLTALSGAVF